MKKSELEAHFEQYTALEGRTRTMLDQRAFAAAFSLCVESFPHIVPTIKYRKQKGIQPETPNLLSFGVICKYAPPLFEHATINALLAFVNSTRMLAKHENAYLQTIQVALEREEIARTLWNHLERQPGAIQRDLRRNLGISQEIAVEIVEFWEQLGVLFRKPVQNTYELHFRSRLDAEVEGVCPACGIRGRGRKELFLSPVTCKKCGSKGYYHIKHANAQ